MLFGKPSRITLQPGLCFQACNLAKFDSYLFFDVYTIYDVALLGKKFF